MNLSPKCKIYIYTIDALELNIPNNMLTLENFTKPLNCNRIGGFWFFSGMFDAVPDYDLISIKTVNITLHPITCSVKDGLIGGKI